MRGVLKKLQAVWKRRQLESDLDDELAFHLAMREEKNRRAGVTESARRSFGNPELVKQDLRDQWTFRAVENFWSDLRVCGADAAAQSGIYASGGSVAGDWDWGEHSDIQCGGCDFAEVAAGAES